MRSVNNWLFRPIAVCLVLWLMFPTSEIGTAAAQQAPAEQRAANTPSQEGPAAEAAAGSVIAGNALPDTPEPVNPQAEPQGARDSSSQSSSSQQPQEPAQPVGTAAAPYEKTMGIAASRPAGAAIAPAKQRRVRTILISVGVIVAAGVAVGSVAGLSHASSSHPQ
jgi:hypothetical protein